MIDYEYCEQCNETVPCDIQWGKQCAICNPDYSDYEEQHFNSVDDVPDDTDIAEMLGIELGEY